ncbi:type IV pilus modification PilV family protein [Paracidovorax citrulli]
MEPSIPTHSAPLPRQPGARGSRPPRHAGFLLTEALVALSLLGTGLLPLAALAPRALSWRQDLANVGAATRAAAEAAELLALCWPRCANGPVPASGWPALQPTLGDAATVGAPAANCAILSIRTSPLPGRPCLPPPRWCASVQHGPLACPPGPSVVMVAALAVLADALAGPFIARPAMAPASAVRAVALWTGR